MTGVVSYVSLFWPEATESLPNTAADVPDDVMNAASNRDTAPAYQQEIKTALNALGLDAWNPALTRLDAMVNSITFPLPSGEGDGELTGTTWQWVETTTPVEQITVDNPQNYTILFNEDSSANIKADCNNVGATYTADGGSITIELGPSTRAACPEGSLDQAYLSELSNAAIYFFENGELFMDLMADGGTMRFQASEQVDLPEPEDGEATATVTAPDGIFLRTGPGIDYPDVGAVAFGESGTIVGVSEDSQWWVVEVPVTEQTPDGTAWICSRLRRRGEYGKCTCCAGPRNSAASDGNQLAVGIDDDAGRCDGRQ